jgi:hypothetical protein
MANRHQKLIERILEQESETNDHSLRKQALDRATGDKLPKTLTPWEWQEWYEAHGVPDSHKQATAGPTSPQRSWWRRLLGVR